ncbi:MAG: hypothetical protein IPO78_06975 [Saprospiraceae bacterium]|nr:hypothetical protein [Saprospiraceae bacterium]MBK8449607.1 hypothetical protein [Saprospiraceae bacterium]MBK8484328.1 hypothetical protein [Saprospiraceae bacterium]MBK9221714.1 hypothetical protein [Saprospiraceae bacterium]MBK9721349.1 hypothetical protein [Saprospiraceae bacterium]
MKFRTNKNSIRFRLSQSEVDEFFTHGLVHECIQFTSNGCDVLCYSLIQADHEAISVTFNNNHLRVYIPSQSAKDWCKSNVIGIETQLQLADHKSLYVLIEKDFQCLQPRLHEDESDNFPNPKSELC